ncbi:zinc knuckle CX2CX4HX4C containing protein, partial [Tanacetum coccineum]
QAKTIKKVVKIKELRNDVSVEGAAVAIPYEAVEENCSIDSKCLVSQYLKKAKVKKAHVWVKLHHVPIVAYSEIGLSLINTQIGKPIMLDSYTSNMCVSSWGRSTYARALIKVSADKEIMESLIIAILVGKDKGHTLATIDIEYEWKPPRCSHCLIFDHITDKCPKVPKETIPTNTDDEGFVEVKKKKKKNKSRSQCPHDGIRLTKPPPKMYYRRVEADESSKASKTQSKGTKVPILVNKPVVTVRNYFDVLDRAEKEDEVSPDMGNKREDVLNVSDSEVDEEIMVEEGNGFIPDEMLK